MGSQHTIEAHIRRLWRHRGTVPPGPRRGPRQQLDLDEILTAAIAVADAEGLAAVSTRSVAARFGKTAMALYPYVGTKDQLLALMQDHASAMAVWRDPTRGLANALEAWATALFELYLAHPWLTELPWSQASHGPNERDWMERLLRILDRWGVASPVRATAITMLYATVRACAQTAADYRRMDRAAIADWRAYAEATATHLPDLRERYPLSTGLEPVTPDWRDNPRAAVTAAIRLLAPALAPAST